MVDISSIKTFSQEEANSKKGKAQSQARNHERPASGTMANKKKSKDAV